MNALLERWTGLVLLDPGWLALALLVPVAVWLRRRRRPPALSFAPDAFTRPDRVTGEGLPRSWRVRLLPAPRALAVIGILLAIVGLARPVSRDPLPPATEGIDVLLCLDTSSSMAANDLDPRRTRLDVAKEAAARFVAGRPDDRIGLVAFARFPDLRCPLTLDHRALGEILSAVTRVEPDGPEDATGIGLAVARAAQVLRGSVSRSKVVILLTDGVENVATKDTPEEIAPLHAGQLCETLAVRVYVIVAGLGDRTPSGEWVALDTRQVRDLAQRTGGRFFEARDAGAVAGVYAEIDALEKAELPEPRTRIVEAFLPFLVAALAALLLGGILGSTWLRVLP